MIYSKGAFSIDQHIEQLRNRGLQINDPSLAAHYLGHVSYYLLAGYWLPMQSDKENHIF